MIIDVLILTYFLFLLLHLTLKVLITVISVPNHSGKTYGICGLDHYFIISKTINVINSTPYKPWLLIFVSQLYNQTSIFSWLNLFYYK